MRGPHLVFFRSLMLASLMVAISGGATAADRCPDVSGRYSVTGFGTALGDALETLHARQAEFLDSGVELHGAADGDLGVGVKSGSTGAWSTSPVVVLRKGKDFDCKDGAIGFRPDTDTHRKTDDGTRYSGASTVSLSAQGGQLVINVSFSGSQRISLYSYESANVSIPRLGTRTTLKEVIRLPAYAEPVVPVVAKPVTPTAELAVRNQLTTRVLGNVIMGWVSAEKDGVEVTLNAPHSDDIAPLEERLRAAAIDYRIKQAPIWTNGAYYLVLVVQPGPPQP
jgi:hypothetical protein